MLSQTWMLSTCSSAASPSRRIAGVVVDVEPVAGGDQRGQVDVLEGLVVVDGDPVRRPQRREAADVVRAPCPDPRRGDREPTADGRQRVHGQVLERRQTGQPDIALDVPKPVQGGHRQPRIVDDRERAMDLADVLEPGGTLEHGVLGDDDVPRHHVGLEDMEPAERVVAHDADAAGHLEGADQRVVVVQREGTPDVGDVPVELRELRAFEEKAADVGAVEAGHQLGDGPLDGQTTADHDQVVDRAPRVHGDLGERRSPDRQVAVDPVAPHRDAGRGIVVDHGDGLERRGVELDRRQLRVVRDLDRADR
jgi:hypothetical protein